jgi:hypothetical protein
MQRPWVRNIVAVLLVLAVPAIPLLCLFGLPLPFYVLNTYVAPVVDGFVADVGAWYDLWGFDPNFRPIVALLVLLLFLGSVLGAAVLAEHWGFGAAGDAEPAEPPQPFDLDAESPT